MTGVLIESEVRIRPHSSPLLSPNLRHRGPVWALSQLHASSRAWPNLCSCLEVKLRALLQASNSPVTLTIKHFPWWVLATLKENGSHEVGSFWRIPCLEKGSAAELHYPTLLHPSPSPAQIFPLNYERSYHWPSTWKIICHVSSAPTAPNKTNNNHKVPSGDCWKGLSFSSKVRIFLPSSYSLFPSAHEETTLVPSAGSRQILELRPQRSAIKSPPSIWCIRA